MTGSVRTRRGSGSGVVRLLAAATAATLLAACSSGADSAGGEDAAGGNGGAASDEPYKIGVLLGLTGVYAGVAEPQQQALELFEQQLETAGGIDGRPVEFVYLDTASNESEAVNQLRRLATQDNVIGVVGPSSSGEGVALKPIAASLQLPMIAIAAGNAIVEPIDPYVFKEFPSSIDSLNAQLAYLQEEGLTRVAMLSSNNGYGQEPAAAVSDLVGDYDLELVASEVFAADATDMTTQLNAIEGSDPDAVLVWAVNPANAIIAQNARDIGFESILFQGPGAASAAYLDNAEAVEGTLVQGSKVLVADELADDDPQAETIRSFVEAWRDEYGSDAGQFAAGAWDAMLIMVEALRSGAVDATDLPEQREQLRDAIEATSDLPGTIAVYDFSEDRHGPEGIAGLAILRVEDGDFQLEATT